MIANRTFETVVLLIYLGTVTDKHLVQEEINMGLNSVTLAAIQSKNF
jgi:hypothetical protein